MATELLQKYIPESGIPFLKNWFGTHKIHIHISRARNSKLGDYQRKRDGSHKITINHDLQPEFFFFVLTHELAHLIAFEENRGKKIAPHGQEWKSTFRHMLHESLQVYPEILQPHILEFSKVPKANFMASGELVKYFHQDKLGTDDYFIDALQPKDRFLYKDQLYTIKEKLKKNYLCENENNGRKYIFKAMAKVEKLG